MKENFKAMLRRHEREISELRSNCKHERVSGWMPYMFAPGHFGPDVRVCTFCGEIVESARECGIMCECDKDQGITVLAEGETCG